MKALGFAVLSAFFVVSGSLTDDEICPRRHRALVIAFLALHRGEKCRELVQKGVQQKIALETALESINTDTDLQIAMKIYDTCSDRNRALESAREAMLFAEQRCSKFPVFLGFLGPEDKESLRAVAEARTMYRYAHVTPNAVMSYQQYGTFNVEVIDANQKAKRIISFLKYLNWFSFLLVFTADAVSTSIATLLLEIGGFCLSNTILRVPSFASVSEDRAPYVQLRKAVEEARNVRIVVITDDVEIMARFVDYIRDEWGAIKYVVYASSAGILPWKWSRDVFRNSVILQEVPKSPTGLPSLQETLANSTLWRTYSRQVGCTEDEPRCRLPVDPTVVSYVYSLHLFSKALRTATWKKCKSEVDAVPVLICDNLRSMNQTEWKSILESTFTVLTDDDSNTHVVKFYMDLENAIDIIVHDDEKDFEIVGSIDNDVKVIHPEYLNKSKRSRIKQCLVDMYEFELEKVVRKVETTPPKKEERPEDEKDEDKRLIAYDFGYYELLAVVIGFPLALILLVVLTAYCVYRSFRSGSDRHQKGNLPVDCEIEDYA